MAKRKRRKARRTKRRGFSGTVKQHRAGAAQEARAAQHLFREVHRDVRGGFCGSALRSFMLGSERFGRYIAEKRHARAATSGRVGSERGARTAQAKAGRAIVAACFR